MSPMIYGTGRAKHSYLALDVTDESFLICWVWALCALAYEVVNVVTWHFMALMKVP